MMSCRKLPFTWWAALFMGLYSYISFAARWDFGTEETTALVSHGNILRDQLGPRSPEFPDFEDTNTSVKFDGKTSRFSFADGGPSSKFDFSNGDAIRLEAWVKIDTLGEGQIASIVGKGRTGDKLFSADNQNWALRLRKVEGKVCLNFLFATPRNEDQPNDDTQ